MPEFLLELFSEEIPARMQARASDDLARLLTEALKPAGLVPQGLRSLYGPRRLTVVMDLPAGTAAVEEERRGPRAEAMTGPALQGFLRATGLTLNQLEMREVKGVPYLYAVIRNPGRPTPELLADIIPGILRRFPWPKSMRWGGSSSFIWVRPLKRILCLFDGAVVPFSLAQGEDDGHGLVAANLTEGHRILAPGAFAVTGFADYAAQLADRKVVIDPAERAKLVRDGVAALAAAEGVEIVPDEGLVAEVAGLVEWPVPLLGRIDDAFMDLPPELMRTTMRVNQRYFALRRPDGTSAPWFALAANIAPSDGGAAVSAGNERVLRARLSDARFFWDQDRKQKLESFLPKLNNMVFHAKLGTQGQRVRRLTELASLIAGEIYQGNNVAQIQAVTSRAARLAKADLATGLVGEFPELQGVIGSYYADHLDGAATQIREAIRDHYKPVGPSDSVPSKPYAAAVALADKIDQLVGFFAIDERPTGSGDPFALRRAALGIIRIIRENGLRLGLEKVIVEAFFNFPQSTGATSDPEFGMVVAAETMKTGWQPDPKSDHPPMVAAFAAGVLGFLADRLRVQLRAEGERHDVLAASLGAKGGTDDDLTRLLARTDALREFLATEDGANLVAAYRRAANILRIEDRKDGPHGAQTDAARLALPEEQALSAALDRVAPAAGTALAAEDFTTAMAELAGLRAPVDAFFDKVVVNDPEPALRRNRLGLLARLRDAIDQVADFSKIEG